MGALSVEGIVSLIMEWVVCSVLRCGDVINDDRSPG